MRIVVKVGTSSLAHATGHANIRHMERLCKVLSDIKNAGHEVVLVSSGAIGMGMGKLSMRERPKELAAKQAAAAVGQCELMYTYDKMFSEYNHIVAQILLTAEDIGEEKRKRNFINTIQHLLKLQVLPIINENDTVATDEIVAGENIIGENDSLSAIVSASIHADLLVILSDVDGLYTSNPRLDPSARLIEEVKEITRDILCLANGNGSSLGTGGMDTKLKAAKIATAAGCDVVITNGDKPYGLYDILDGKKVGTRFIGVKNDNA